MSLRKESSRVNATDVGLGENADVSNILLLDHLSPRKQRLFIDAKAFKSRYQYKFCWVGSGVIYLRRKEDTRPLKVKSASDLERIIQDEPLS